MPRFYVQHEGKWNVFSSIVDDFLFKEFVSFEELKARMIAETCSKRAKELNTLLTANPELNVKDYRDACADVILRRTFEQYDGDPKKYDMIVNKIYAEWEVTGAEPRELERRINAALGLCGPESH